MAQKYGKQGMEFEAMCDDKDITGAVLRELVNHGKKHKLEKFEVQYSCHSKYGIIIFTIQNLCSCPEL